ncbi:hypothetical protein [Xenorhabdus entomophaga]|uniref:hypothetical protein n=1 Tax=Xenorhabdus entomophaga TaxID=3136257 RepID=UPI0030F386B9
MNLAQNMKSCLPSDWRSHEEWRALAQRAVDIACQHCPGIRISEWDERYTWEERVTDIHLAALATRKTVEFFLRSDPSFLPNGTNVFLVSTQLNEFLASIVGGDVHPVWVATVDTDSTPGCRNGFQPKYSPRII